MSKRRPPRGLRIRLAPVTRPSWYQRPRSLPYQVPKSHKEEVGAAFQSAHNSSGWDRKVGTLRRLQTRAASTNYSSPHLSAGAATDTIPARRACGLPPQARWQRAVNLAKAKMGISGPDESIDKWGPASKDGAAAEVRRRHTKHRTLQAAAGIGCLSPNFPHFAHLTGSVHSTTP